MSIILIGGQKGGTGKSTIATNLAVEHVKRGGDTILVDTDYQGSSALWRDLRNHNNIEPQIDVIELRGDSVAKSLLKLREKYETIFVDAGGKDSKELRQAMGVADKLYTPIKASQFDVVTIETMCGLVNAVRDIGSQVEANIIISMLSPNPKVQELREALEFLQDYKDIFTISTKAVIKERKAFRNANSEGMAVSELKKKDFGAMGEIKRLYNYIFDAEGQENGYQVA